MAAPATKRVCSPCTRRNHDGCTNPAGCVCETCYPERIIPTAPAPKLTTVPAADDDLGIVWEDPPEVRGRRTTPMLAPSIRQALIAHPGRWARIKTYDKKSSASSAAQRIKKGQVDDLPPGDWEPAARVLPAGGSALYLRHINGWVATS